MMAVSFITLRGDIGKMDVQVFLNVLGVYLYRTHKVKIELF